MSKYVWSPDERWIEEANITRFMRQQGCEVDPGDPQRVVTTTREFVRRSQDDIEWFWKEALRDMGMTWTRDYETVLDTSRGNAWADWFVGGETSIVLNCVDRHAQGERARKTAIVAESENGEVRHFSYLELATEVGKVAMALRELGVGVGDTVACYMPMVAEVAIAMLATQKVGAIFIPIFSGYAPPAVRERLEDADVKVLFTADGSVRRGKAFPLKQQAVTFCLSSGVKIGAGE